MRTSRPLIALALSALIGCASQSDKPAPAVPQTAPAATAEAAPAHPRPGRAGRAARRPRPQPLVINDAERSSLEQAKPLASAAGNRPNIVFVLTDDMAASDLVVMPKLRALVTDEGTSFSRFFVTDSLCCPSRSSILRGQYVHNHHTMTNDPPAGGFEKFHGLGNEGSTIATWLQGAGYRTALMGKYLNGYPNGVARNYIPPGWTEWDSPSRGGYGEFNYLLNENGELVEHGSAPEDYLIDVMAKKALAFIDASVDQKKPFFIYLAPFAPHQPATPAPRHAALFADAKAPRDPSFDEADVSDKPQFVQRLPRLSETQIAQIDALHRKRLQSLQAVDDLVESLVRELERRNQLDNTYIVFTSDNGFHLGQHRMQMGKTTAFETDIRVPLIVRGPGVKTRATRDELLMEIDLAPTFAQWAGLEAPSFVDGRSFAPLLADGGAPWRTGVLIEHYQGVPEPFASQFERQRRVARGVPAYKALRTATQTYVEYTTGEKELYDLTQDPFETENVVGKAGQAALDAYSAQLQALAGCAGATCRSADAR